MRRFVPGVALSVLGALGHASANDVLRASVVPPFNESVQSEVAVSGNVVVGAAATSAQTGGALLAGVVVPRLDDSICVVLQSRDGVYFAQNGFIVPSEDKARPGRWMQVDLGASRQSALLGGYGEGDLAVAVKPGPCGVGAEKWLVAGRTDAPDDEPVDILVNAFGATDVRAIIGSDDEVQCDEYLEGRRTNFDFRCRVPRHLLSAAIVPVRVERERFGRPLAPVSMDLVIRAD